MLINLFNTVKSSGVPCSLRELLDLIAALDAKIVHADMNDFYYLSRSLLVKDEKYYDKFDKAFEVYFKGMNKLEDIFQALIPEDWLRKEFEKQLTEEELNKIKTLGGLEKLLEEFKKRFEEQKERHQGGDKWIGTGGTSPFGNSGQNPEGIRVGGSGGGKKAVKVWEQRQYKNLDDSLVIGTRNIKMALRRLRKFVRQSNNLELDMPNTIKSTAKNGGILDINMVPEKTNAVKVLIFFDVGGSMDPYVRLCEELFSAIKTELKNLEYFYFHNCIYETVWKDNKRRTQERYPMQELINKFSSDYKVIIVGDATMAPYEITNSGGSIEHWNEEPGIVWLKKLSDHFEKIAWLNPVPDDHWDYTSSVCIIRDAFDQRMYALTLKGLETAMTDLSK
ncbi:MAG: VWA domain-containing protein [Pseudomonadota bacterium]|nr:VWA domain-containing protein [Pseudomonadota bacterium]MEC8000288.1 VWA domain-containing protein [Pseudomonadota bacterium]|tara:strand:- start:6471 stop:7646 length:1176 start_codon:yes stop_codon:yes gene_type:complete